MAKYTGQNQNILQNAARRSASNARPTLFAAENIPATAGIGTKSPIPGGPITSSPNASSGGSQVVSIREIVIPDLTQNPDTFFSDSITINGVAYFGLNISAPGTSLIFASATDETSDPPVQYPTFQILAWMDPQTGNSTPITMSTSTGAGVEGIPFSTCFVTWIPWTSLGNEIVGRIWVIYNPSESSQSIETGALS